MSSKLLKTIFVGWLVLLLISSAIYFAPANLLGVLLLKNTKNTFTISQPQGRLLDGSGNLITFTHDRSLPKKIAILKWNFDLSEIFRGKIILNIQTDRDRSTITWQRSLFLNINNLPIPLGIITYLIPEDMQITWKDLNARGNLIINNLQGELINNSQIKKLTAIIEWKNASLDIFPVSPIGDYQLSTEINQNIAQLNIKTLKGPLSITGGGKGEINRINLQLILSPNAKTQEVLIPVLRFWGQPISENQYSIHLKDLIN